MAEVVIPPNNTVYVRNLNEKIQIDELKKSLFHIFSQYGKILDLIANKTLKLRGQAFIIYEDVTSATKALRELSGFNFYGKPMKVNYAKSKSDLISQADGTFIARPKRKIDGQVEVKPVQKKKTTVASAPTFQTTKASMYDDESTPSELLLFQNLPNEANRDMIASLLSSFEGFKDSRFIESKPGICFVEFAIEYQATKVMESLQGFRVTPQHALHISYARK